MMKTVLVLIAILVLAAVFTGCGASGDDITGLWYDKAGLAGTIEFKDDGTATLEMADQTYTGTYTYDIQSGEGKITLSDPVESTSGFKFLNREINVDDGTVIYTREEVNSKKIGNIIRDLTGGSGD